MKYTKEIKEIIKREILEVSFTQSYQNFIDELQTLIDRAVTETIKDVKKKLPKLQGFDDYDKHVHTYATENKGNCGICGLSWKRTTETGYYNQAIFDVKKVLRELEKSQLTDSEK